MTKATNEAGILEDKSARGLGIRGRMDIHKPQILDCSAVVENVYRGLASVRERAFAQHHVLHGCARLDVNVIGATGGLGAVVVADGQAGDHGGQGWR